MFQEIKPSIKNRAPSTQVKQSINSINATFDIILDDWNSMNWLELHQMNKQQAWFINELRVYSSDELRRIFVLLGSNKQQTIIEAIKKYSNSTHGVSASFINATHSTHIFLSNVLFLHSPTEVREDEPSVKNTKVVGRATSLPDVNF